MAATVSNSFSSGSMGYVLVTVRARWSAIKKSHIKSAYDLYY